MRRNKNYEQGKSVRIIMKEMKIRRATALSGGGQKTGTKINQKTDKIKWTNEKKIFPRIFFLKNKFDVHETLFEFSVFA